jgi:Ca2+-binding EF-hand superfamily protein
MKAAFIFAAVCALSLTPSQSARAGIPGSEALVGLILEEMDLNADGIIDAGEWQSGTAKGFEEIDTNHDGNITEQEIDALSGPISETTGDIGAKLAVVLIKKLMMSLDTNGDKIISKAEYTKGCEAIFKKLDANHDGQISKEELTDLPLKLLGN